ncbi:TetR/AcrR family transcriptional regulator [Asanoa iriomotensis]|uniref:TetR family transcriptional regulator n=1 Tax=Asanoa iriomotensis TaxID=234613 RepID=A0ABQ4C214_9ACTN|nr:TetR family transcriptional regulator [Asanoa iriomotensis]GIF56826.1 TetR family transcriptional regulator [Asanoa iriomotensis]
MSAETRQPRAYRSPLRSRQAAETRDRILDAAGASFAADGYGRTTLAAIADRAGVSVETVQANGPKRALLVAAFERAFTGDEGSHQIAEREVGRQILATPDLAAMRAGIIGFVVAANERTAALWRAYVSAADSDPEVMAALDDMYARRGNDIAAAVAGLVERGAPIADPRRAADVLSFLLSPEGYEQLVLRAGWSHDAYARWLDDAIAALR